MKTVFVLSMLFLFVELTYIQALAQEKPEYVGEVPQIYVVIKNDGVKFVGEIISQDAREILIRTETIGEVYVPKHEVKEIRLITKEHLKSKKYVDEELFATRYFITTNGLPIKKGENYMLWNLYGPDFQFGVAKNFGVGVMTSWMAIPVLANAKYSLRLNEKNSIALGAIAGTGSWAFPEFGLLLPFASYTIGDRFNNLTFSTGYGLVFYEESLYNYRTDQTETWNYSEGRILLSLAGMVKITPKMSLVFDSFIMPRGPYKEKYYWTDNGQYDQTGKWVEKWEKMSTRERTPNLAILLPGLRWQLDADKAFQFGFTGVNFDDEFVPFPIPMVQFYRRL